MSYPKDQAYSIRYPIFRIAKSRGNIRPIQNKKTEERLKKVNKEEDGSKDGQRYADVTS